MKQHDEFSEFCNCYDCEVPSKIKNRLSSQIHSYLNPSRGAVLAKLGAILVLSTPLSLLFCPQFGVGFTVEHQHHMHNFSQALGPIGCMLFCGAIFLATCGVAAALFLTEEEARVIRRDNFLQFAVLALAALGAFICFTEVFLSLAFYWVIGAILGGIITFELAIRAKKLLTT